MAAIASFSRATENLYIPGFKGIMKKMKKNEKIKSKKKISGHVAAILIIGGKLKILSGDHHTHG